MAQERPGAPISRELVLSLYLPATMLALGQSMVAPVIPGLAKSFDVSLSVASLVFVAISAGAAAATFPAGYLMDRTTRRARVAAATTMSNNASWRRPCRPGVKV